MAGQCQRLGRGALEDLDGHRTALGRAQQPENTMQVADSEATFTLQTRPTLLQQRCFELLGVTPRM